MLKITGETNIGRWRRAAGVAKSRIFYPYTFKAEARSCLAGSLTEPKYEFIIRENMHFPTLRLLFREGWKGIETVSVRTRQIASHECYEWDGQRIRGEIVTKLAKMLFIFGFTYFPFAIHQAIKDGDTELVRRLNLYVTMVGLAATGLYSSTPLLKTESDVYDKFSTLRYMEKVRQQDADNVKRLLKRMGILSFEDLKEELQILGLSKMKLEAITLKGLKKAYRQKAKLWHPDRTTGDEESFKKLNLAYLTVEKFLSNNSE
jgi:hypothetical protein